MIALILFSIGSDPSVALFICAVMAIALIAYTFYPPREIAAGGEKTRLAFLKERKETVYDNLRDLNFEYKAGKYPEDDYRQMRMSLEEEAATLLAEIERLESVASGKLFRGDTSVLRTGKPNPQTQKPKGA